MKKINSLKYAVYGFIGALPSMLLAQEGGGGGDFDLSAAGTAATSLATEAKDLLTGDVLTAAKTVLGCLVTLWVVWKIAKWCGLGRK